MKIFICALSVLMLGLLQIKHTEKLFGTTYRTTDGSGIGDHEIYYHIKTYSLNGKVQFGIMLKGVRNDTIVMTTKKRVFKDKIIVTKIYHDIPGIDSAKTTLHFKNGKFFRAESVQFPNHRSYPWQPKASDLEKQ